MTIYYSVGSPDTELNADDCRQAMQSVLRELGHRERVIAIPPDYTRRDSQAGLLTCLAHEILGDRLVDVLPALGTHDAMTEAQLDSMFPTVPRELFRVHRWRTDVVEIGRVPSEFVSKATEGIYTREWPVEVNRMLAERRHDLILSIGQVVPHEVVGMANYSKNLFVGTGGKRGINESHFIGAAYGMERMMGVADTPLRQILNYAQDHFCRDWPLVYVLTVVSSKEDGGLAIRGLFIGDDHECFRQAAALSAQVNFTVVEAPLKKVVVWLDDSKFHSTWLGNKAVYRTRMAIADDGELIVLAPGVRTFGEDPDIDRLIRKYGYRTTPEIMQAVEENAELRENLSAAAHLIHGSSEGRFGITYCPGHLKRDEIEGVGYQYADLPTTQAKYDPQRLRAGVNHVDGEEIYFIPQPALGLWASQDRAPQTGGV